MHFGLFYVAEFVNLFIIAGVAATIFLGGWMPLHIPGLDGFNTVMDYIPGFVWFFAKSFFIVWLLMWIKWTFPRLRIDQILTLEWKYLVPIGLCNLLLMVIIVVFKIAFLMKEEKTFIYRRTVARYRYTAHRNENHRTGIFHSESNRAVSREPCYTGNLSPFSRASRHAGRRKREQ
mgnify:CR=1 FL=1